MKKPNPAYVLYRAGRSVASAIPDRFAIGLAERAGNLASGRNADQRAVVRRNLSRVVGSAGVEPVIDAAYRSYARYWIEALRMPKPGLQAIHDRTTHEGLEHLERYRKDGRGVIIVLPHVGSYDIAGAWISSLGWKIVAVAEEVEPPELFEMFRDLRRGVGVEILGIVQAVLQFMNDTRQIGSLVISLAIAGVILWYLFQPHVKAAFGRT